MREFVSLDSGPLGQACRRYGIAPADQCRLWIDSLMARAVDVVVPEVAASEIVLTLWVNLEIRCLTGRFLDRHYQCIFVRDAPEGPPIRSEGHRV